MQAQISKLLTELLLLEHQHWVVDPDSEPQWLLDSIDEAHRAFEQAVAVELNATPADKLNFVIESGRDDTWLCVKTMSHCAKYDVALWELIKANIDTSKFTLESTRERGGFIKPL